LDDRAGAITDDERAKFERFKLRRPNFGAGVRTLMAAALWQHFEDCYDRDLDVRLRAALWLQDEGRDFWIFIGLPPELYAIALDENMPASLRNHTTQEIASKLLHLQIDNFREKLAAIREGNRQIEQNQDVTHLYPALAAQGKRVVRLA
jgi:hypothetical protein